MPFKSPFDGYYKNIIKPAVEALGLEAKRADEIYGTRPIIRDIWEYIWRARVIIADVTGKNPNVNYELGLSHALGIPTVLITKKIKDVPFDYQHRRVIVYDTNVAGWEAKLQDNLKNTVQSVLSSDDDNEDLPWPYNTLLTTQPTIVDSITASDSLRDIVLQGTQKVGRLVAKALGPTGLYPFLSSNQLPPTMLRQGHSIAQGVRGANALEHRGVEQMRLLTEDVYRHVGDYTKIAVIVAESMMVLGSKAIEEGCLPKNLIKGMRQGVEIVLSGIQSMSKPVRAKEMLEIAVTAADDVPIGELILKAMNMAGQDGVITIEESSTTDTTLEIIEGMEFDQGYLSDYFITDFESMTAVLDKPFILLYDRRITSMREMLPLLEAVAKAKKPLLIIAEDVEGEALATLVANHLRGVLKVAAVRAPGHKDRRKSILEDIAILTGAKIPSLDIGVMLENVNLSDLGSAKQVVVTKETTTIVEGAGNPQDIKARIKSLRQLIRETTSGYEREKYQERLAKLIGAVATIKIGGTTSIDVAESKYKASSAMYSVSSSIEEGWVPGGCSALYYASRVLRNNTASNNNHGMEVVRRSLIEPLRHLINNSQVNDTQIFSALDESKSYRQGFNADTRRVEDLSKAGILDSAKGLRLAIQTALSHATAILNTSGWDLQSGDILPSGLEEITS